MSHRKEVKQNARFTGVLFVFFLLFLFLLIFGGYTLIQYRMSQNTLTTKTVGNTISPCRVVLALQYDIEPVDVTLISPSGQRYQEEYDAEHENNTMIISTITNEKGDWLIEYNKLRNKTLNIKFRAENIDKLLLEDVTWNVKGNQPSVSFKGNFGNGKTVKYKYDIILTSRSIEQSDVVAEGNAKTGKTVTVKLNMTDIKSANDWQATLNIYTLDEKMNIKKNDMTKSESFSYTKPKPTKKPSKKTKTKKKGKSNGKTGK